MKLQTKLLIGILTIAVILISGCAPEEIPEEKVPEEIGEELSIISEKIEEKIPAPEERIPITSLTISMVYDNNEYDPKLKTAWGTACLIEIENKKILFDTGGDSLTLLDNMKKMDIDLTQIDIVVLSHIHGDHVGGLDGFLEENNKVTVYVPSSFPDSFRQKIAKAGADFVDVDKPIKICGGVYSTGELGTWIKEQSLVVDTAKGLVVISGCAHPGIADIVRKAKELLNKNVYLVLGGFHSPPLSVVQEFKELEVEKVAPCHCTGDRAIQAFKGEYEENFIKNGVGKVIRI